MPHFTMIIKVPNGQPVEGVVSAANIEDALAIARQMGHDVDEEATRKLHFADAGGPGKAAVFVAAFLAIAGAWYIIEVGLAAIIVAVLAIEFSRGRRGLAVLVLSIGLTIAGIVFRVLMR